MATRKDVTLALNSTFDSQGVRQAQSGVSGLAGFTKGAGIAIAAGLAVGTAAISEISKKIIDFAKESAVLAAHASSVSRGLENAVANAQLFGELGSKSVQKVSKALDEHSKKLGEMSGIDDEIINQVKTGWLAVPDLAAKGAAGINNLAQVTADVAAGTGKDFQTIALAFTKVTGDEETALGKLNRAGIVLSDTQKQTYQDILDANGQIAAQDYLIGELGKKYEGMAKATANPLERIQVMWQNLQETVGMAFMPALTQLADALGKAFSDLSADPAFQMMLQDLSDTLVDLVPQIVELVPQLIDLAVQVLPDLADLAIQLVPVMIQLAPIIIEVIKAIIPLIEQWSQWVDFLFWGLKYLGELIGGGKTFKQFANDIRDKVNEMTGPFRFLNDTIWNAINAFKTLIGLNPSLHANLTPENVGTMNYTYGPSSSYIPEQAAGGITTSPGLSWVGENGPELLNLPRGAQVTPLDKMGGSTYNITINGANMTPDQIVSAIKRFERTSGPVFARA